MADPIVTDETVSYLAMTCSTAALFGMSKEAMELAEALISVRPDNPSANVVFASALMSANNAEEAVKILETRVLEREPDNDNARAYLGLAHKMLGRETDMQRALDVVIAANRDPNAVAFARVILE